MHVFVTGATGFVGRNLIRHLLDSGHNVRALVRGSEAGLPETVETVIGDTRNFSSLSGAAQGCDAIINLVGIIREFPSRKVTFKALHVDTTAHLVEMARQEKISRFLQMSANGTRENAVTSYHRTKWEAEQILRQSDLDWTIFRPSLIYGPKDAFVNMLAGLIRRLPHIPVMGDGNYRLQPVSVNDVAGTFTAALDRSDCFGKTYHCCGATVLSYNQLLSEIGAAMGRSRVRTAHLPLGMMQPLVGFMQHLPFFPITSDQLTMLLEENICATDNLWRDDFSLEPADFSAVIRTYLS